MFSNLELAILYIKGIRAEKPRYVRDQLILLKQTIESTDTQTIDSRCKVPLSTMIN